MLLCVKILYLCSLNLTAIVCSLIQGRQYGHDGPITVWVNKKEGIIPQPFSQLYGYAIILIRPLIGKHQLVFIGFNPHYMIGPEPDARMNELILVSFSKDDLPRVQPYKPLVIALV